MSDYTPTTEEMRSMILKFGELIAVFRHEPEYRDRLITEFDRWLAEVKAQAWEEGFQGGYDSAMGVGNIPNPYRQGEEH